MKKKILLLLFMALTFSGCGIQNQKTEKKDTAKQETTQQEIVETGRIGDNMAVTRGQAAKMIAMAFYTQQELKELEPQKTFGDVPETLWCYPYVNGAVTQGFLVGDGESFLPEELLTLKQAEELMERLNPDHKTSIILTEENQDKPVAYSLWMQVYEEALKGRRAEDSLFSYGVLEKNIIPLETVDKGVLTAEGLYRADGYDMTPYFGRGIKTLVKEKEIVGLLEVTSMQPVMENACLQVTENGLEVDTGSGIHFITEGIEKLQLGERCYGDVQIDGDKFLNMSILENNGKAVVKKVSENGIELDTWGNLKWDENAKVYEETDEGVVRRSVHRLICGTDTADFYLKDNTVRTAVIRRKPDIQDIRVVLSNTGQQGYLHTQAVIIASQAAFLEGGGQKIEIAAGQEVDFSQSPYKEMIENGRMLVAPQDKTGIITIKSIMREGTAPSYRGTIEIEKTPQGFVFVNELSLEEYLRGVVPGEMPTSFGVEALKVQAVSARSYAYNQYFANRYDEYGAHVDDTTNCQVYKGVADDPVSDKAVKETEGVCLTFGNKVVNANFYSTSSGYSSNSGEVWYDFDKNMFPAENKSYLISKPQGLEKEFGDLTQGKNAAVFLKDQSVISYDSDSPWFRWQAVIPWDEFLPMVNRGVEEVWKENAKLVQVLQADGSWSGGKPPQLTEIEEVLVAQRGEGGIAMVLEVKGGGKGIRIETEYAIRKVLRPMKAGDGQDIPLKLKDGTERANFGILPSAFITLELQYTKDEDVDSLIIYGGGSGHGAGMSQYGSKGMAEKGFTYDKILEHYFEGAKAQKVME